MFDFKHQPKRRCNFGLLLCISLLFGGCATNQTTKSDFYFLPCEAKASVSFEGETQAGPGIHRFEIRRLAYRAPNSAEERVMWASCVIYYAGDEDGPYILKVLDEALDPYVRKISRNAVEVYFLAGAHSHFRQRWTLLGSTAKLESEDVIEWSDDPRNQR